MLSALVPSCFECPPLDEQEELATNLKTSIEEIKTKKVQNEQHLIQDTGRVVTELEAELKQHKKEIANLEEVTEDQVETISKLRRKLLKANNMKEAAIIQDR